MSKVKKDENLIKELLIRGVEKVVEKKHLEDALLSGKQLRVKFGIDPTAPDLHLGHSVPLRKLRQFQDLGHKVVLIFGDFTAKIGDPTGKNKERKPLSDKEIKRNMKDYLDHASLIIDIKKAEIRYNSEWFKKEGLSDILILTRAGSLQQVLRRADFKKRMDQDNDITMTEVLYPLLQGYDSVKVKADVEIGGSDQLFNLLMGRRVQRHYNMPEQDILTVPLLVGTDGEKKMSKSIGNYISLSESPSSMFGKIMSIPDELILNYFELCTDISGQELKDIKNRMSKGENPRDFKMMLGEKVVGMYHSEKEAQKAKNEFIEVFSKKQKPTDIPEYEVSEKNVSLADLLVGVNFAKSKSEAKRLIKQGGVKLNDEVIKDEKAEVKLKGGEVLQVGKRRFVKIKV